MENIQETHKFIKSVNKYESDVDDNITLDSNTTWEIVRSYLQQHRGKQLVAHQLDSYDNFIEYDIPNIIKEHNPILITKIFQDSRYSKIQYQITFDKPNISNPITTDSSGRVKKLYPDEARIRHLTYSMPLSIGIKQTVLYYDNNNNIVNKSNTFANRIVVGHIPIMVYSKYCLVSRNIHNYKNIGECRYDLGGYFIINGSEKVIVSQERMCDNRLYIFKMRQTKYSHICECRSSKNISDIYHLIQVKILSKDGLSGKCTLKVRIPHLREDIPIFILFRALGFTSDKEIVSFIAGSEIDNDYVELLKPSIIEANDIIFQEKEIKTQEESLKYINNYLTTKCTNVGDYLNRSLLPHLGNNPKNKCYFLGYMIKCLLDGILGKRNLSDRDHYSNKRVELPGTLLSQIFRRLYNKMLKDLKASIYKEISTSCEVNITKLIKSSTIENGFKFALATGNWNIKAGVNKKVGVAQVLNRLTYSATLSHLRRLNTPIDRSGKLVKPRQLHNTHIGILCPAETPEGQSVGIVKNLALTANITIGSSDETIKQILFDNDLIKLKDLEYKNLNNTTKILLNGDWVGVHKEPIKLVKKMLNLRRHAEIDYQSSIVFDTNLNEITINTDTGRCCRPLYIVGDDNKLLIKNEHMKKIVSGKWSWKHLIRFGLVEYIDVEEMEICMVAMNISDLEGSEIKYTHCEIHPSLMLGVCASMIPFPDHNQSPRNTYQSAMGKQAMGVSCTTFLSRVDTLCHFLHYPQKPLVTTKVSDILNLNELPAGENVIVAIACYSGYNQEDSLIMNQSSIDRGLFNSTFYRTYRTEERKNLSTMAEEKFCRPDKSECSGLRHGSYDNLNENGLVKIGTIVSGDDIIIGKKTPIMNIPSRSKKNVSYKDNSISLRSNESGIVDRVILTTNTDGYRLAKVRVRSNRIPEIGDKFSSRHGQKGTIGMVYRAEDMPFTEDGITPDIIINPACIPSRMTIGQLLECTLSKRGAIEGKRYDGTPFNRLNIDEICDEFKKYGFNRKGTEVLYNGQTGERIETEIFIGPTFYQRLKHMVKDKIHSRSTGPVQNLTRQPAEGRSRDGGLRLGEMEVDCLLSHGASGFLKERIFECSDMYSAYVCNQCGLLATVNPHKNIYLCNSCGNTNNFSKINLPFASKLLWQELYSLGIIPRIIT
jgi:DNA-directed RNA polymerase II subunit RPB2